MPNSSLRPLLGMLLLCGIAALALAVSDARAATAPTRGMSMSEVRAAFGAPGRIMPPDPATAQGPLKPPIVRWVYPDFTVYFERGLVIHTVLTHPREAPPLATTSG